MLSKVQSFEIVLDLNTVQRFSLSLNYIVDPCLDGKNEKEQFKNTERCIIYKNNAKHLFYFYEYFEVVYILTPLNCKHEMLSRECIYISLLITYDTVVKCISV